MNFNNPIINFNLCLEWAGGYATGMFLFCFSFGTACSAIMLAVASGATISCILARLDGAVLSLSFFDVFALFLIRL
jgi:hypothetical protein